MRGRLLGSGLQRLRDLTPAASGFFPKLDLTVSEHQPHRASGRLSRLQTGASASRLIVLGQSLATAWIVVAAGCGAQSDGHAPRYVDHEALKALAPADARKAAQGVAEYGDLLAQRGGKMSMTLDFSRTGLSDDDLARFDFPDGVTAINLSDTKITDAGLVHLGRARNLQRLDLSGTAVTAAGLQRLEALPKLWQVNLEGCPHVARHDELHLVHILASRSPAHVHERHVAEMLSQGR